MRYWVLVGLMIAHIFGGALMGRLFPPGAWVEGLSKPVFYPPALAFPVVWTTLYALMGLSLWFFWSADGHNKRWGYYSYAAQLCTNYLFTPLMFGLQSTFLGFMDVLLLIVLLGVTIRTFHRHSPKAAYLLIPYFVWTCFALILATTLWRLNL